MAHVLLVDDDTDVVRLIRGILTAHRHLVTVARDGLDALTRAAAQPFDLVIVDRELPRVDGFEVCRRLRAAGAAPPILLMTSTLIDFELVQAPGAPDAWLMRPFLRDQLLAQVDHLLARRVAVS